MQKHKRRQTDLGKLLASPPLINSSDETGTHVLWSTTLAAIRILPWPHLAVCMSQSLPSSSILPKVADAESRTGGGSRDSGTAYRKLKVSIDCQRKKDSNDRKVVMLLVSTQRRAHRIIGFHAFRKECLSNLPTPRTLTTGILISVV